MLRRLVRNESGVSLTEVMVAGAMASIIATAFLVIFFSFNRSVSLEEARAAALGDVQAAAAELAVELRQAVPLADGSPAVEKLESGWPTPEIIFYSDRTRAAGPERYRYFIAGCSGTLCELHRQVTVADAGGPPWAFTGAATTETLVANVLSDGAPLFIGSQWLAGSETLTTSCDLSDPCQFFLVKIVLRVDAEPRVTADAPLQVRHEVRLRNAR